MTEKQAPEYCQQKEKILIEENRRLRQEMSALRLRFASIDERAPLPPGKAMKESSEQDLSETGGLFRELADSITDMFFLQDHNLKLIFANKAYQNFTGMKEGELMGRTVFEILGENPAMQIIDTPFRKVLESSEPLCYVEEFEKDGEQRYFETSIYPSKKGISVFSKDVTEGKKMQEELKKTNAELRKTNAELRRAMKKLEEQIEERTMLSELLIKKNEELEEFSGKVSHELKNNLVVMKRIMEMAELQPEFLQQNTRLVAENSDRLMEFVERTLTLARSGNEIGDQKEVAVDLLIQEIFARMKPDNIEGALFIVANFPVVRGDPRGLGEVFSNLICNSFQHRDPEKDKVVVQIDFKEKKGQISLLYRDNGKGIPEEDIDRVFDATFSTKENGGFGFGLAIAKKIIEAHWGKIEVKSGGKGCGTEFLITLPHRKKK